MDMLLCWLDRMRPISYCVPRGTQDMNLVVEAKFIKAAQEIAGEHCDIHLDPQLGFESVTAIKRVLLTADATDFKIKVFELSNDSPDQARFKRRLPVVLYDTQAWAATPEDTIVTKIHWSEKTGRGKDRDDAQNVMAAQHETLDWPYIEHVQRTWHHTEADRIADAAWSLMLQDFSQKLTPFFA